MSDERLKEFAKDCFVLGIAALVLLFAVALGYGLGGAERVGGEGLVIHFVGLAWFYRNWIRAGEQKPDVRDPRRRW